MRVGLLRVVAVASVLFAASAARADNPWSGFYLGAHAAYNDLGSSGVFDNFGITPHVDFGALDLKSGGVGVQGGYNYQMGKVVLGVEADIQVPGVKDSFVDGELDTQQLQLNTLASVRARLGYTFNSMLLYGTAGVGFVKGELSVENATGKLKFDETAFVYGGGVEYLFAKNLTFRVEYLRYDIGKTFADLTSLPDGDPGDFLKLKSIDSVRLGFNWKMN